MDRRTVIAAAAVLPITGAVALARADDPVIAASAEWSAMHSEYQQVLTNFSSMERQHGILSAEAEAYNDGAVARETVRIMQCEGRIAGMVAFTAEGMAAQLRVMGLAGGYFDRAADSEVDARFVRSLLAAAERIAEVS